MIIARLIPLSSLRGGAGGFIALPNPSSTFKTLTLEFLGNFVPESEQSFDSPTFSNKRPVDETDDYDGQQSKKMRVEAGEGPNTLLRILVNSKVRNG